MIDALESKDGFDPARPGINQPADLRPDHRRLRRNAILTAAFGIAHALILMSAFLAMRAGIPSVNAPDSEVVTYYHDATNRRLIFAAGLYLIPFAAITFIWFIVALRMWATHSVERASVLFANVQLVSGIVYIGVLLAAGSAMSIPAAIAGISDEPIDPDFARQFPHYGTTLLLVVAMRMAAMYVFSTTSFLRHSGILPRWFVLLGGVVGLALLFSASVSPLLVIVFPSWLLALCVVLLVRAWQVPAEIAAQGQAPASPLKSTATDP